MERIPNRRPPAHPGETLLVKFLEPLSLTQFELADAIGVPYQHVNDLVEGRRGITPSTALRLGQYFGMSTEFWIKRQMRWDLYFAREAEEAELERVTPHPRSGSTREESDLFDGTEQPAKSGKAIVLDADVSDVFNAKAVNDALRLLARSLRDSQQAS